MDTLPDREADFVDLYFFKQIRQTSIAEIYRVSQPTVCYRLQRATSRIRFLLELPVLVLEDFGRDVSEALPDPLDVRIMYLMYGTACRSEVAKILQVSQGLVRHRFIRSIHRLQANRDMAIYAKLFEAIANNLNIRREVQRSWEGRVCCVVA
jgi:DNA-directed RNA polymerase specialized sigma subunit